MNFTATFMHLLLGLVLACAGIFMAMAGQTTRHAVLSSGFLIAGSVLIGANWIARCV